MYVAGRRWEILVLLRIQTIVAGMVVLGGHREKEVISTVLNEIGVRGLNLEVYADNEPYLVNLTNWLCLESKVKGRLVLESPLFGILIGYVYRTRNAHCQKLKGGIRLEVMRGRREASHQVALHLAF